MIKASEVMSEYSYRYPALQRIEAALEIHLRQVLSGIPRVDAITSRAKSPDRFVAKALKTTDEGSPKYDNPLFQIQDQVGSRITVFYLSDVTDICARVGDHLTHVEVQDKAPAQDSEFGYFGVHFILRLPDDVIPDGVDEDLIPEFFELQVKTLFQHAWSEAHHDLGYKSKRELTSDEKRKVAFTAAQAWGADTIFEQLAEGLCSNDNSDSA
jgi:putative GTP pyrophosphokinase